MVIPGCPAKVTARSLPAEMAPSPALLAIRARPIVTGSPPEALENCTRRTLPAIVGLTIMRTVWSCSVVGVGAIGEGPGGGGAGLVSPAGRGGIFGGAG